MGCYICVKQDNGEYKGIYCNRFAELNYTGRILTEYYNDAERADELIELGDIYYIGEDIKPAYGYTHSLSHPQYNVTFAYGRDGGEENLKPRYIDLNELFNNHDLECVYIFEDEVWKHITPDDIENKQDVEEIL